MIKLSFLNRVKVVALTTLMAGGTLFGVSCNAQDVRDNFIAGVLAAVEGAANNWVDGIIPDLNELNTLP